LTKQRGILFGGALLLAAAIVWWAQRNDETAVAEDASQHRDVPVIIYVVDTLRADRLGLYGYAQSTSARIDALASDSVVFDQAYAPAPWTTPSVSTKPTRRPPGRRHLWRP
jgi:glucan phosphoethanolaminetransferase (alkaline phosphatase superfamily)